MSNKNIPVELTTHNIFFHENSPILSFDQYNNIMATCGYDKVIRIWEIKMKKLELKENKVRNCENSSISIKYKKEFGGFSGAINCCRFYQDFGKIHFKNNKDLKKNSDSKVSALENNDSKVSGSEMFDLKDEFLLLGAGDDRLIMFTGKNKFSFNLGNNELTDIAWIDMHNVLVSLFTGEVLLMHFEYIYSEVNHWRKIEKVNATILYQEQMHKNTIRGLTYNPIHGCFTTHSLDSTVRVTGIRNNKFIKISEIDTNVDESTGFYKRNGFINNNLYSICSKNMIEVYCYPFTSLHLSKKIGPFQSSVIKIFEYKNNICIVTQKDVYYCTEGGMVKIIYILNASESMINDAFICEGVIFLCSGDGLIRTIRF